MQLKHDVGVALGETGRDPWSAPVLPSPGWYADPAGQVRWWDGQRWTELQPTALKRPISRLRLSLVGAMAVGLVAVSAWGLWLYANHDRTGFIDDPDVAAAASRACTQLTVDLRRAAALPSINERVAAESSAVVTMVASIRSLGEEAISGDHPTSQWLDDWEALAASHALGGAVPTADGEQSIVKRMDELVIDSSLPECAVPPMLRHDD